MSTSTSTDLNPTTVQFTFSEDETSVTFDLEIINEETPEFEERFELVLTIENNDGDSEDGARVGSFTTSLIVVSENDYPHGLFTISTATNNVAVAEDVGEREEGGSVEVRVERSFGASGSVQVRTLLFTQLEHQKNRTPPCEDSPQMFDISMSVFLSSFSGDMGAGTRTGSTTPILY